MTTAMAGAPSAAPAAPSSAPASSPASTSTPSPSSSGASSPSTGEPKGQGSSGGSAPAPTSPGEQQAKAEKAAEAVRKHKLKVNGREMEFDEPEVIRRAQLAEAADQKFREGAEMRKQAADLLEAIRADPEAVLSQLGVDVRSFSEKKLAAELKKEMLTPEQRELEELRAFKTARDKAEAETKQRETQTAQERQMAELSAKSAAQYDTQITDALKTAGLSKTPEAAKRVAARMLSALQQGYEIDAATAADLVRQDYMADVQALFGSLEGESLMKLLGDGMTKKMRQYDLARIKSKLNPAPADSPAAPAAAAPRSQQPTSTMSPEQWIEHLRKKAGVEG